MSAFHALIPAAGSGNRMGSARPKQYLDLNGRPMLWHSLAAFERHPQMASVHLVLSPQDEWFDPADFAGLKKLVVHRVGGATRADSVRAGLEAMAQQGVQPDDWVLVHDAARPGLTPVMLDRLIDTLRDDPVGGILALPLADTLKRADADGRIAATVPREALWGAQTPQMFRHGMLLDALYRAGSGVTDEASAIEFLGLSPRLVSGGSENLKVTWPADLEIAAFWLTRNEP